MLCQFETNSIGGRSIQILPGQYFDKETGLAYNYFRDYDSQTRRYVQSDPIGLAGGLNTYLYVDANPLSYVDPEGLLLTATLNELTRGEYRIPTEDAIRVSQFSSAVALTGATISALGPLTLTTAVEAGAVACRAAPEVIPKIAEACKNPAMAVLLGASICGSMSGTVKGSARDYVRQRERIQEIRDASGRMPRRNTGSEIR